MASERNVRTFSVEIDRSAAEVFAYLSDIKRHGEWSPAELRIEPVAPGTPMAIGAQYRSFGSTRGRPFAPPSWMPTTRDARGTSRNFARRAPIGFRYGGVRADPPKFEEGR